MGYPYFAIIGAIVTLAVISNGIVVAELVQNPERGYRTPEVFRSGHLSPLQQIRPL